MDWVKLHTRYFADERIESLDDAAELMFVRGLARAGELERAGFIPETSLPLLARRRRYEKLVSALVASGLWTKVDGGYRITAWSDWQDAADALTERRAADRERKRRQRDREREQTRESTVSRDNGHVSRDVTPTEGEGEKELRGVVQRAAGGDQLAHPPPKTCTKHPDGTDEPCRGCQSARLKHETWQAEKRQRLDSAPKCRTHAGQPADNCALCASERKARRKDET